MIESDIAAVTSEYRRSTENEWSLLRAHGAELELDDTYVTLIPESRPEESRPERDLEVSGALRQSRHLVFVGPPGIGKSTLLQYIGLCQVHEDWYQTKLGLDKAYIPIKIDLRIYGEVLARPGVTMVDVLNLVARKYMQAVPQDLCAQAVEEWIRQDGMLLLLDGLDEVKDAFRGEAIGQIRRFARAPQASSCRCVVTSRQTGYSTIGTPFEDYTVKPFGRDGQADWYLGRWMRALRPDWDEPRALWEVQELLRRLKHHPALKRILDTPLLLRLAAQNYVNGAKVAGNRAELYRQYVADLWRRAQSRGLRDLSEEEALLEAENLAWQLHVNAKVQVPERAMSMLREKLGLVNAGGAFEHTTIQEYFVARRLSRAWKSDSETAWAFIHPRLHLSAWREPIMLMAGQLEDACLDELIVKIVSARSRAEDLLHRDKLFITSLAADGVHIPSAVSLKILNVLTRLSRYRVGQQGVGSILRKLRIPGGTRIYRRAFGLTAQTSSLIVSTAALGNAALPVLLELLGNKDSEIQEAAIRALAKLGSREAIPFLWKLCDEAEVYSVPVFCIESLALLHDSRAIPRLLEWVRSGGDYYGSNAAWILAECRAVEVIPELIELFSSQNSDTFDSATRAVGSFGYVAVPYLRPLLTNGNPLVRAGAVKAMGWTELRSVLPDIRAALNDQHSAVREQAHWTLLAWDPDYRTTLQTRASSDSKGSVSTNALDAALQAIQRNYPSKPVMENEALGFFEDTQEQSVVYLCDRLRFSAESSARWAAAVVLGSINATAAVPELCLALADPNLQVKLAIIWALGALQAAHAVPALLNLLSTPDLALRRAAVKALGNIRAPEAIGQLRPLLKTKDLQSEAIIALGKIKVPDVMPYLRRRRKEAEVRSVLHEYLIAPPDLSGTADKQFYRRELLAIIKDSDESEKLHAVEQLEWLDVNSGKTDDPFKKLGPSKRQIFLRRASVALTVVLVAALGVLLSLMLATTEDVIKKGLAAQIEMWVIGNLPVAIAALLGLGVAVFLVAWLTDWLKSKL